MLTAAGLAACGDGTAETPALDNAGVSAVIESDFNQASTTTNNPPTDPDRTTTVTPEALIHPDPLSGQLKVEVIAEIPHNPTSYTQGLAFENGRLLESQGLKGESARSWIDTQTGRIESAVQVHDPELFAEGITLVDGTFIQLTWKAGRALVGDADTLAASSEFSYTGEGWGVCFDGERLVRSDGTNTLYFHDPETFQPAGSIPVASADGLTIENLNELECVGDQVIANIWGWDYLVVTNIETGGLDAVIDATSLRPEGVPADLDHALNGVAHDPATDTYYLTGKLWPTIFHVRLIPA